MSNLDNTGLFQSMADVLLEKCSPEVNYHNTISSNITATTLPLSSCIVMNNTTVSYSGWDCDYCGRYNVSIEKNNCIGCGAGYKRKKQKYVNIKT